MIKGYYNHPNDDYMFYLLYPPIFVKAAKTGYVIPEFITWIETFTSEYFISSGHMFASLRIKKSNEELMALLKLTWNSTPYE